MNGLATFFDLSIATAGTYTLTASTAGLGTAVSTSFTVAAPAPPPSPPPSGGGGGGSVGGGGGGGGGGAPNAPSIPVSPGGRDVSVLPWASTELSLDRSSVVNSSIAALGPNATETASGSVRVTIPPFAIPGAQTVVVLSVANIPEFLQQAPEPPGHTLITAVLLGTFGANDEPVEIPQFSAPVELTLTIPGNALPTGEDGSKLVISYWDGKTWSDLVTTARRDGNSVVLTTALQHFSTYGVLYRGTSDRPKPAASVGAGTFSARPVFSASGQAFVVYASGSAEQLEAAAATAGATGVWVQDTNGKFFLLVVRGPAFLRQEFEAAFPLGFAGSTAMTLVRS